VLKKSGTAWVVMGDTYWSAKGSCHNPGGGTGSIETPRKASGIYPLHRGNSSDIPYLRPKSLSLIPSRFAIEMCNRGWTLRNIVVWHKPNCIPSSAKDRFTADYEFVLFFVKSRNYYFRRQLEPYSGPINRWGGRIMGGGGHKVKEYLKGNKVGKSSCMRKGGDLRPHPCGRNPRCVWTVPTRGSAEPHFAVFPERLVEIPIKAGCPKGGIVLDPFAGSGTTAVVARRLGRRFIGVEVNPKYCRIARERVRGAGTPKGC
jgi:site-specific DNA-methyltransferase (cytosine-N4-specific)